MERIRVAWGVGAGPTELAAYDAALVDTGVGNHNLRRLSSVIPPGAAVDTVGTADDIGRVGTALDVVEAGATGTGPVAAGLGWMRSPSGGVFYEASGTDPDAVQRRLDDGLRHAREIRDWRFDDPRMHVQSTTPTTTDPTGGAAGRPVHDGGTDDPSGDTHGSSPSASLDPDEPGDGDADGYVAVTVVAAYGRGDQLL
ncbi:pyruvoyl-dependent arginine decarboxylase subunit alpha [Halobacteriales archaeon SW_7_68_16]|nr:MAG: pyruvoyl-dependent arginine decarboxylase subunit alpha [Halobacteriales archaeon SW_7_68_16]